MTTYFAQHGFSVEASPDDLSGLSRALDGLHDVIILDVMLPGLDGFAVLRKLRKSSLRPVIMLTARAAHQDRIAGLNTGVDDYLHKPFAPEEPLARIRAVLRRSVFDIRHATVAGLQPIRIVPVTGSGAIGKEHRLPVARSSSARNKFAIREEHRGRLIAES